MSEVDIEKCKEELEKMFVCTFGYWEVEHEIMLRCLEAIKVGNMEPLKKNICVFCVGDFSLYQMGAARVCMRLYQTGIWQYVKEKIKQKEENR